MIRSILKFSPLLLAISLLSCNDTDRPQDGYVRQSGITPTNWIGAYQSKNTCDDCEYAYKKIHLNGDLTFAIREYAQDTAVNLTDTGIIEWIDGKRLKLVGLNDASSYLLEDKMLIKIDSNLVKIDTITHQFTYIK